MDHRNLKRFFQGLWTFNREVRSMKTQNLMSSVTDGCASFVPWKKNDADTKNSSAWLLYRENGTLDSVEPSSPGGTFTRQHLYDFSTPESVKVYFCEASERTKDLLDAKNVTFDDAWLATFKQQSFFYNLNFDDTEMSSNLSAECVHPCEKDLYVGTFTMHNDNNFSSLWKVTGPTKSYQISTNYHKSSQTSCS